MPLWLLHNLGGTMVANTFKDRAEAGRRLADALVAYRDKNPLVLAIPRGGVIVAKEIVEALEGELNVIVPRKIGAPGDPEFAIGAVMEDGTLYIDEDTVKRLGITRIYIEEEKRRQLKIIKDRVDRYRRIRGLPEIKGRIVILVDDGMATGATVRAALMTLSLKGPKRLILALPVAPLSKIEEFEREMVADEIVCILKPIHFWAISEFYENFSQIEDEEVEAILRGLAR